MFYFSLVSFDKDSVSAGIQLPVTEDDLDHLEAPSITFAALSLQTWGNRAGLCESCC